MILADSLKERGLWTTAIRPPTVPVGSARIRVTLSANHSSADISALTQAINELG